MASENGHRPESVITFTPDDASALYEAVESAWESYESTRSAVVRPEVPDTVETEVRLLLDASRRGAPRSVARAAPDGGQV